MDGPIPASLLWRELPNGERAGGWSKLSDEALVREHEPIESARAGSRHRRATISRSSATSWRCAEWKTAEAPPTEAPAKGAGEAFTEIGCRTTNEAGTTIGISDIKQGSFGCHRAG